MTEDAPQRKYSRRELFNGLGWTVTIDAPWRYLPKNLLPWQVVVMNLSNFPRCDHSASLGPEGSPERRIRVNPNHHQHFRSSSSIASQRARLGKSGGHLGKFERSVTVVNQQAKRWIEAGVIEPLVRDLRVILRLADGRDGSPTAAILDSRTMHSTSVSGARADNDGAKRPQLGAHGRRHARRFMTCPRDLPQRECHRRIGVAN
jgi:transposase